MVKTVFITGASSGIGEATAKLFQQKGWNVVATMRSPQKAADWTRAENTLCPRLDVTDNDSIRAALDEAQTRFGQIDVLVNNAGYALVGPFEASTSEQMERQFAINVLGLMTTVREILPHFREQGSGTIVNVASMGGRITFPLYSLYHGTKWAVEGFSESLMYELAPLNIKVKIVEPGPIRTDFYGRSQDLITRPGLTAYDPFIAKTMPNMKQAGDTGAPPEQVAQAIYRAATDGSSKLRYQVNSDLILWLRKLLPDAAFFAIVRLAVVR